jgi:hypothetical protein
VTRQSFSRFATPLVVALSLGLAAARAGEIVAPPLLPVEEQVTYSLPDGASTRLIKLPDNVPVMILANSTTPGDYGVVQATVHCIPNVGLQWAGISYYHGAFTGYYPATSIITYIDDQNIFIGVFSVADCTIHVTNAGIITVTGTVKVIY